MTIVDVAGGSTGGAARFRREAERWLDSEEPPPVRLIGIGQRLEPRWLARRELIGRQDRRIATNMSFLTGRGQRIVLLRNALHFMRPSESDRLPGIPKGIRLQTPLIRAAARRADVIVVPCSDMADRVVAILPTVAARVQVRFHPLRVTLPREATEGVPSNSPPYILYPSMPSAHKDIVSGLHQLCVAIARAEVSLRVKITCLPEEIGDMADDPIVEAVGSQTLEQMDHLWAGARAAYSPYAVESFNYPIAESRAIGIPMIALDTAQNSEIGGSALVPFASADPASLVEAIRHALALTLRPDPHPFEPGAYFSWLTIL